MSTSINKVILIGNLGKDAEVTTTKDGQKMVKLSLVTKETWKDKDGSKKEKTEWHKVIIFCEVISEIAAHLKKGCPVYVEGRLQTRKWLNDNNVEQYITEVVVLKYSGKLIYFEHYPSPSTHVGGEDFKKNKYTYEDNFDDIPY